jgi:hypothetical protein
MMIRNRFTTDKRILDFKYTHTYIHTYTHTTLTPDRDACESVCTHDTAA